MSAPKVTLEFDADDPRLDRILRIAREPAPERKSNAPKAPPRKPMREPVVPPEDEPTSDTDKAKARSLLRRAGVPLRTAS